MTVTYVGLAAAAHPRRAPVRPPATQPTRTAPCWSITCRGVTTWALIVPSAHIYQCTTEGCTARRELTDGIETVPPPHEECEGYVPCPSRLAAEKGARRERGVLHGGPSRPQPGKGVGSCGNCGRPWRVLKGGVHVQACGCDPHAPTCPTCSRTPRGCMCHRGRAARGEVLEVLS